MVFLKKIFISHSSKDIDVVTSFIHVLQSIGIEPENIFCTSIVGYGTPLGSDFMQEIETRLNEDVMVFFMLSDNFYQSPMCLIEMGATWIKTKHQISVAITPFELDKIKSYNSFSSALLNLSSNNLETIFLYLKGIFFKL